MDISNSVQITPVAADRLEVSSVKSTSIQRNDALRPNDTIRSTTRPSDDGRGSRQDQNIPRPRLAAPEDLEKRSNEIQFNKIQRVDNLDSAPLRNQQAVNTYQQTVDAGREYLEGELVGVDLFV